MSVSVALHTIGQTPRPDLTPFLVSALGVPDIVVTGALNGLSLTEIPPCSTSGFPLETRLSDGTRVEVDAAFLAPLLQANIDENEEKVQLHIVLCAGEFPTLKSEGALIRPFEHACDVFISKGYERLMVVVPFDEQVDPAKRKWQNAGFEVSVRSMQARPIKSPADQWLISLAAGQDANAFVLDYVGYSRSILNRVREALPTPVYDLGYLATDFARAIIQEWDELEEKVLTSTDSID